MRAFVTGSAGFVGQRLIPRLEANGYDVVATDREVEVSDESAMRDAVGGARPDLLLHLAALSSVAASWDSPDDVYRVNFLGTRSVLEAARNAAPKARVIVVGSGVEYGSASPGAKPFDEAAALRPDSPYARTKAAADLLGEAYAARGLDVIRTRTFTLTGPGQRDDFALASFARQAVEIAAGRRESRMQVGNLDSVRDYLDVDDAVAAYLALADRRVPAGAYNVSSGTGVRIGDALDAILDLAGVNPSVEVDPTRLRDADYSVGDPTRLREASGWMPRTPFSDTLERLVADWRERVNGS